MNQGFYSVLGAIVALIGALWVMRRNNHENTKRLQMQLDHDTEQRRLERESALQHQIYLEVIESLAQWQQYLSSFSMTNVSTEETNKIMDGASQKFSKGYVIGSADTLLALNKLNLYFAKKVYSLSERRYEHNRISEKVERVRTDLNFANERVGQATNSQQQAHWQIQFNSLEKELKQAIRQQDALTVQLTKECSAAANEFASESIDTIIAVRREIGMPLSEELQVQFRNSVKELSENLVRAMAETMDRIQERFGIDSRMD